MSARFDPLRRFSRYCVECHACGRPFEIPCFQAAKTTAGESIECPNPKCGAKLDVRWRETAQTAPELAARRAKILEDLDSERFNLHLARTRPKLQACSRERIAELEAELAGFPPEAA